MSDVTTSITLPKSGINVEIRLLKAKDTRAINRALLGGATTSTNKVLTDADGTAHGEMEQAIDTDAYQQQTILRGVADWDYVDPATSQKYPVTTAVLDELPGYDYDYLFKQIDTFNKPPSEEKKAPGAGA